MISNQNKHRHANLYRLQQWKSRLNEFTDHESVKSLRDEVGILRIVLEETMNRCSTTDELLLYSSKISDIAVKIEKLVTSCDRLERNMGQMMDRPTAIKFASNIIDVIANHIDNPDKLDAISQNILDLLKEQ